MSITKSTRPMQDETPFHPHTAHWGAFEARYQHGRLEVRAHPDDPDPNRLIENFPDALRHRARIARPMVRRGWLENGPGPDQRRGRDEFVPLEWDRALDLLAGELRRVHDLHGPGAIFGGSYGWSSAGRFHHAQSQVHRFLNTTLGGYVKSVNSYSAGASAVLIPRVLCDYESAVKRNVSWEQFADHTELVLAFGGMALKNSMVAGGGTSRHIERGAMNRAKARGCEFVLVSPIASDLPEEVQADWISANPGTDTALMLGILHTLVAEGLHDQAFLERYTVGWEVFVRYLTGQADGQAKDAEWAAAVSGVDEDVIRALARRLPGRRSLIVVAHSLQRAEHGEQPVWMGLVLAAALGQIGLPGGGYGYGMGALAYYGRRYTAVPLPTLSQGKNGVRDFIPVARIADMLLGPGTRYRYNGETRTYPDIRLVYWAGGNPFHHHQDLNRLRKTFREPDTIVVHELGWTATARHADFVLPATMTLERDDIGGNSNDPLMLPMRRLVQPFEQARDDYRIFADLAKRLGKEQAFTEGRDVRQWLEFLYERTRAGLAEMDLPAPSFAEFWEGNGIRLPLKPDDGGPLRAFREDPQAAPLPTPSGKIEIYSETIASFGEADCLGHPAWIAPQDIPNGPAPLTLISNQPATRLHSQLDFGEHSAKGKQRGREIATMHAGDAALRGIKDGDIIRIFNDRGACLAAARLSNGIRAGVVQLPTGAWYDPENPDDDMPLCVHGNPNVLTRDIGTSALAQGCTGQLTTVQVERFNGNLPPIRAYDPPEGADALYDGSAT